MAFSRQNDRFYKEWTAPSGALYRITFQPGYHLDPSGVFNDVELPDNIIIPDTLKIKGSFDKDIPMGMPKARSMAIEMDLRGFTGDFVDVGTWMLQKKGASQRTVNGRSIDIPNRWFITFAGTPGGAINRYKFDGIMDIKPEDKLPVGNDDFVYKLECLGMERAVIERVLMTDLTAITPTLNADGSPITRVVISDYTDGSHNMNGGFTPSPGFQIDFNSLVSLTDEIFTFGSTMMAALTRQSTASILALGDIYTNITFYERTTNIDGSRGSAIANADLLFASTVATVANNIGGQLVKADGTDTGQGGWAETYDNAWDLLKYLCEGSRQKIFIQTNSVAFVPVTNYRYLKMFEEDNTSSTVLSRTLTKADLEFIDKDSGLPRNGKLVSSASMSFDSISSNDITKIELFQEGIISQNRFASDLLLHNHPTSIAIAYAIGNDMSMPTLDLKSQTIQFPINRLYYQDGAATVKMVHYTADIDYGDSITQSNSTISSWPSYNADTVEFKEDYNASVLEKTQFTGLGNLVAQSTLDLMANTNQYLLPATCKSTLVDINDLGNIFTIDIDEIKNDKILITYPKVTTTTVLVSVEEDPVKEITKCKFFIRGTNSI